jgi:hypothetical protein
LKVDVNVPSKSNKQKKDPHPDPDWYQTVTDPQHWGKRKIQEKKRTGRYDKGQENYRLRITEDKENEKELARK